MHDGGHRGHGSDPRRRGHELEGHRGTVTDVAIVPDGTLAVTTGSDHTVRLWNIAGGFESHVLRGHTRRVTSVKITPDGSRAITTSRDRTARIWDLIQGKELYILRGHTHRVPSAVISSDGGCAVTISGDDTARTWNVNTGMSLQTVALAARPTSVDVFGNGTGLSMILGDASGAVTMFSSQTT